MVRTKRKHHTRKHLIKKHGNRLLIVLFSVMFISGGIMAIWFGTLKMPDLESFRDRKISESTKIYDRTGTILLFDAGANIKRTALPLDKISPSIQDAVIAIEDSDFYKNIGIEPLSIARAILADITTGGYTQGASTITQQVIKNALLTQDKTITRKLKELVLAVKLTRVMEKEKILEIYLNETPYGGTIYGVEEASQKFFGKPANDVTLAEAAYLAAIPQAPSYYSPYGAHKKELDQRQRLVLQRMLSLKFISSQDYKNALAEKVEFSPSGLSGIKAPHFVMFVRDYLAEKYGEEAIQSEGLKVITTLDYSMQADAEETIADFSPSLASTFNASNTGLVAMDPKTGDILTMVGSKDYFSKEIDGNFNVTTALRQPGSTFKPFVYATLFEKGYTPETILFDVKTEFSQRCQPDGTPKSAQDDPEEVCYSPSEYDDVYSGPMDIRKALAQSRNIPAVKALYLAGIQNTLKTVRGLGITSLNDPARYGLTLVLGGGEVSMLELAGAYGSFANNGVHNPYRAVLEVTNSKGQVLEKASLNSNQAISPEVSRQITSILSDKSVRMNSLRQITESIGRDVAVKTGTTNDYRDVWTVGYTPNLVVAAWAGNNDNSPMQHNVAGLIISPLWGAFMAKVAQKFPDENFSSPPEPLTDNKPVLRGIWQGGFSYWTDTVSQKIATDLTPPETRKEVVFNNVHSILYWLNKDDPRGPAPQDPKQDPQFEYWEYGVRKWLEEYKTQNPNFTESTSTTTPTITDDVHVPGKIPSVGIISPAPGSEIDPHSLMNIQINMAGAYPAQKTEVYLNGKYVLTSNQNPLNFSFVPQDIGDLYEKNTLSVTVYDSVYNRAQASTEFIISR